MRKLEQTCLYNIDGEEWKDEWMDYSDVDVSDWRDEDVKEYVRRKNKEFKVAGNNTRLRSIEVDDEHS